MTREASSGSYVHAYVPAELAGEFARLAEQNYRSISRELRLAMVRHLEAETAPATEHDRARPSTEAYAAR